jgi:Luciferase-like monooxygenase
MHTETTAAADPEPIVDDRARPERSNGAAPEAPFDAGLAAPCFRLPKGLITRILDAEPTAATSISAATASSSAGSRTTSEPGRHPACGPGRRGRPRWPSPTPMHSQIPSSWPPPGCSLPGPSRWASPASTSPAGIPPTWLAPRRPSPTSPPVASCSACGPDRPGTAPAAGPGEVDSPCVLYERIAETIEAVDRLVGRRPGPSDPGPIELVVEVPTVAGAELAGRFGVGWLPSSLGLDPDAYAAGVVAARRAAAEAGHGAAHLRFGLLVDAVVHEDPVVVADALDRHLVRAHIALGIVENGVVDLRPGTRRLLCDWANGEVSDARMHKLWATLLYPDCLVHGLHGRPDQIAARLQPYVDAGARRVVLRNLVGLGRPHEALAGERATAGTLRLARLRFDGAATT